VGRLSYVQIFGLQTWFMLMAFLMEVPTGAVADRFGRKVSVACGAFLLAAASLLYGASRTSPCSSWPRPCSRWRSRSSRGPTRRWRTTRSSRSARGRGVPGHGPPRSGEAAGIFAGALVGAVVAARLGVRWPMLLQAAPMGLSGLIALTLTEPPRRKTEAAAAEGYLHLLSGGLHHFRSTPELRALALDQVACATVAWLVIWLYQLQLARVGVPLAAFGVVHAAMGLGQIALLSRLASVERAVGGRAGSRASPRSCRRWRCSGSPPRPACRPASS